MQNKSGSKVYEILSSLNRIKWLAAGKSVLCGLAAGLLVVLFRLGMGFGIEKAGQIYAFIRQHPLAVLPWLALIGVAGWAIARLVKYEPMASGSGIPQVEGMVIHGLKIKCWSVLAVRFLAGILSSFFGLSLGREGPSIQIGAAGSQAIAKKTSKNKLEENTLITAGAAAGLATAFNAPLSGVVFALEEVHRSFSALILITATTASLTADVVATLVFGLTPILSFTQTPQLPTTLYLWLLPLGILSGVIGSLTNKSLLGFQSLYNKIPAKLRPGVALLIALPFGLFLPQVLGGGANLIDSAEIARSGILFLLFLLAAKLLFTCTSFGSGIPGGIFLPILSIGALLGSAVGLVAVQLGMPSSYISDFAVCGMAGALSSSVKAPVTSILLTAEMTGSLVHLFPVAACSFIALLISDLLKTTPIYEALLERMMSEDGTQHTNHNHKHAGIVEIPVESGSLIEGKRLSEVELPGGMLIVGIHRGETDIVPNGDTVIKPGDYLTVLSSEHSFKTVNSKMRDFCHNKI
ncbi:MAG TPA: ClC family H(+)/Cl(-) exchange transporter [Candidatus Limiplasma sp.]|nr:ClC family H(+)/Cl(-) exchange transporter [Candidatus Limiplasma sp.]